MSVSLWRTIKNIKQSGWKRYVKQMNSIGDAKAGTLVGIDDYGNEFYETDAPEEIHLRTRWVEYKKSSGFEWDFSQIEPGWHYWLAYGTETPPNKLVGEEKTVRAYPVPEVHDENYTGTPGAYIPYNTAKPKFKAWDPKISNRG
jgi:NADH:ubiquinone oxidoreductase subunit